MDEAHCLSQWSYNFRPAFLRIRREIQFIQPRAVLALTATATPRIQQDVRRHLSIAPCGLLALPVRRDNLQVTVHMVQDEEHRRKMIVDLVKNPRIVDIHALAEEELSNINNTDCNNNDDNNGDACDAINSSITINNVAGKKRVRELTKAEQARGCRFAAAVARNSMPLVSNSTKRTTTTSTTATAIAKGRLTKERNHLSIVYVWRRYEADNLGEFLRASGVPVPRWPRRCSD